jgi:predicted ATP-grasp superfamily ATP-dependent carboligase
MTERTTLPLSADRERIEASGGRFVLPAHADILRAFDKTATQKIAADLGIATPGSRTVRTLAEARDAGAELGFPVVLKGRASEVVDAAGNTRATGAPRYATDVRELDAAFADVHERSDALLIQEFVPGGGAGYFALLDQGKLQAEFAHRRIRDVRPQGSGSAVRESVPPDPVLREASLAILRELNWHGVAMVEYRLRPDGTPVFLEVNGRFWNSLALAIYAGADFPRLLADIAERGVADTSLDYRAGVRCRWLLGDARHLAAVFAGPPAGYPGRFPSRLRTLVDVLRPVPGTMHDNFQLSDPLPELGDWLDFAFRRIPAALRARSS